MKKVAAGFAVVALLIAGGALYLSNNLDSIAKSIIEEQGSAATQTTVSLDGITITLKDGQAVLKGLHVANPVGYGIRNAMDAGTITVQVDPASLPGDGPVIIRKVLVDGPTVSFITNTKGESNLQAIRKNAAQSVGESKTAGTAEAAPARKVFIENLTISNGQITISHDLLENRTLSEPLPTITLRNIGKRTGGATTAQITRQVLAALTPKAAQVASNALVKELGPAKAVSSAAGKAVKGLGSKIQGAIGN